MYCFNKAFTEHRKDYLSSIVSVLSTVAGHSFHNLLKEFSVCVEWNLNICPLHLLQIIMAKPAGGPKPKENKEWDDDWLTNWSGLYFRICYHFVFCLCLVSSDVLLSCYCGDIQNVPLSPMLLVVTVLISGWHCYWTYACCVPSFFTTTFALNDCLF